MTKFAMSAHLRSVSTAVLLASSAAVLLMTPALSADLPTRKAPPAPMPVAAAFSWTGFYVGGVAGYEQNSNGANETGSDYGQLNNDGSFNCSQCGYDNGERIYNLTAADQHFTAQGFGIGGTAGYNYQVSPMFLIGLETDLSWWNLKGSANGKNYIGPPGDAGGPQDREIVSFDGRTMVLRWMDPEVAGRYGTGVYVRCAPEGVARAAPKPRASSAPPPRPQ